MFKHESIEKLWKDIQWFGEKRKAAAEVLLQKLDKGGDISSVVVHWSKSPYAKISLLDHTIGVVREAMKLDDAKMLTYQLLVLAALGHDISKMRGHLDRRKGKYYTIQHAIKSASLCQEWLRDHLPELELEKVVKAVELHHEKGHEQEKSLLGCLIRADLQERRNELNQLTGDQLKGCKMISMNPDAPVFVKRERDLPPIQPPDPNAEKLPFFDPLQFLVRLKPYINNMDAWTGRGPEAVSMSNGVCYVTTYCAFKIVREWGNEVGYGELMDAIAQWVVDPSRMNNAGYFIGQQLREIGALAEHELPSSVYTHRKFRIIAQYGKYQENQEMFYIPILTRFLGGDIVALEERKRNTLFRNITKIYPDTTVWKKRRKNDG